MTSGILERMRAFEPRSGTKLAKVFRETGVRSGTPELERIDRLPRRALALGDTSELSAAFRRPRRSPLIDFELRPIQMAALEELYERRGLVASIRVGGGKTLISFLAPAVLDSRCAVLLVPADLQEKTRRDFHHLGMHFDGGEWPWIVSYSLLGREHRKDELERRSPDLLIADEAHYLKNRDAAVTKRVMRYLDAHPECAFVAMSGTLTTRALRECAHLYDRALREGSPLPRPSAKGAFPEVLEWGLAIDEELAPNQIRMSAGGLSRFFTAEDRETHRADPLRATRAAVRRRMQETPGVVTTTEMGIATSLRMTITAYEPPTQDEFARLRGAWEMPDGRPIVQATEIYRTACALAVGFFYRWVPTPPEEWLEARRAWGQCVRHILKHNARQLDSYLPVYNAVKRGEYDDVSLMQNGLLIGGDAVHRVLETWEAIEPTYEYTQESVWISKEIAQIVRARIEAPTLIWVNQSPLGHMLSEELELPYYASHGRDATGRYIEDHPRNTSAIASIRTCAKGRNLQAQWSRNLVIAPPPSGEEWEQLIGRTHRDGQLADEVHVDVLVGCREQLDGFDRALGQAAYAESISGQPQKLGYADLVRPEKISTGLAWS